MRFVLLLLTSFQLLSCATLVETLNEEDSAYGYKRVRRSGKSDKFVRTRIKSKRSRRAYRPSPSYTETYYSNHSDSHQVEQKTQPLSTAKASHTLKPPATYDRDFNAVGQFFWGSGEEGAFTHHGAQIFFNADRELQYGLGLSVFGSDKSYWGFDFSARYIPDWNIAPYVGAGLYLGDYKRCSERAIDFDLIEETCEKFFLSNFYPELGVRFRINREFAVALFWREYSSVSQDKNSELSQLTGANLQVTF